MKRTIATLLTDAQNIAIKSATDEQTEITFTSPTLPDKTCIHILSGRWEIESINRNVVHLINHDQRISNHEKNNLETTNTKGL